MRRSRRRPAAARLPRLCCRLTPARLPRCENPRELLPLRLEMSAETALDPMGKVGDPARFDQYNAHGLDLFKDEKFADAVLSFRQALELRKDPTTLHNLGVAFAKLRQLD